VEYSNLRPTILARAVAGTFHGQNQIFWTRILQSQILHHQERRSSNSDVTTKFVLQAGKDAANLALLSTFSIANLRKLLEEPLVFSRFDPDTETILGRHIDEYEDKPVPVTRVFLYGTDWVAFSPDAPMPPRVRHRDDGKLDFGSYDYKSLFQVDPGMGEVVSNAATCHVKSILERHGIPTFMVSFINDLPKGKINFPIVVNGTNVNSLEELRKLWKKFKYINPTTDLVFKLYGFSDLELLRNEEIWVGKKRVIDQHALQKILAGNVHWHLLESELRTWAKVVLDKITDPEFGLESIPRNLGAWREQNRKKMDEWKLIKEPSGDGGYTYQIEFTRKGDQARFQIGVGDQVARFPIGVEFPNGARAPTCQLMLAVWLDTIDTEFTTGAEPAFSHGIFSVHDKEALDLNGGIFIARYLFGVSMHVDMLVIDSHTGIVMRVERDGKGESFNWLLKASLA
jgi:hypothetical protein